MDNKTHQVNDLFKDSGGEIVSWGESYATGIMHIDDQHKKLINLTNELYHACLAGNKALESAFKESMSRMVEYVHFHFSVEQELLKRINYPNYNDHKKQHETLIKNILDTSKEYGEGVKFVPNHFVRTLKDWVLGHIAVYDKLYASYILEQRNKGLISDKQING